MHHCHTGHNIDLIRYVKSAHIHNISLDCILIPAKSCFVFTIFISFSKVHNIYSICCGFVVQSTTNRIHGGTVNYINQNCVCDRFQSNHSTHSQLGLLAHPSFAPHAKTANILKFIANCTVILRFIDALCGRKSIHDKGNSRSLYTQPVGLRSTRRQIDIPTCRQAAGRSGDWLTCIARLDETARWPVYQYGMGVWWRHIPAQALVLIVVRGDDRLTRCDIAFRQTGANH